MADVTPIRSPKPRTVKPKLHVRVELGEALEELDKARSILGVLLYAVEQICGTEDVYKTLLVIEAQLRSTDEMLSKVSDWLHEEGALKLTKEQPPA